MLHLFQFAASVAVSVASTTNEAHLLVFLPKIGVVHQNIMNVQSNNDGHKLLRRYIKLFLEKTTSALKIQPVRQ